MLSLLVLIAMSVGKVTGVLEDADLGDGVPFDRVALFARVSFETVLLLISRVDILLT